MLDRDGRGRRCGACARFGTFGSAGIPGRADRGRTAQHLFFAVAQQVGHLAADKTDSHLGVERPDSPAGRFDQVAVTFLADPQRLTRALGLAEVFHQAQ